MTTLRCVNVGFRAFRARRYEKMCCTASQECGLFATRVFIAILHLARQALPQAESKLAQRFGVARLAL